VTGNGTRPNPKLCKAIQEFARPTTLKQLQCILGMCSFFKPYVRQFAYVHELTKDPDANAKRQVLSWQERSYTATEGECLALM